MRDVGCRRNVHRSGTSREHNCARRPGGALFRADAEMIDQLSDASVSRARRTARSCSSTEPTVPRSVTIDLSVVTSIARALMRSSGPRPVTVKAAATRHEAQTLLTKSAEVTHVVC